MIYFFRDFFSLDLVRLGRFCQQELRKDQSIEQSAPRFSRGPTPGIFCPRAAAFAFRRMNASSIWLRLTSHPLPLARTSSDKSGFAAVSFCGSLGGLKPGNGQERKATQQSHDLSHFLHKYLASSYNGDLQFGYSNIAYIRIFLDFLQQGLRRYAIEIQNGQRLSAWLLAAQAHAGNINIIFSHQCAQITNHAGPVFVVQQEQDTFGDDLD